MGLLGMQSAGDCWIDRVQIRSSCQHFVVLPGLRPLLLFMPLAQVFNHLRLQSEVPAEVLELQAVFRQTEVFDLLAVDHLLFDDHLLSLFLLLHVLAVLC